MRDYKHAWTFCMIMFYTFMKQENSVSIETSYNLNDQGSLWLPFVSDEYLAWWKFTRLDKENLECMKRNFTFVIYNNEIYDGLMLEYLLTWIMREYYITTSLGHLIYLFIYLSTCIPTYLSMYLLSTYLSINGSTALCWTLAAFSVS
jgi:hypothetical protein